MTTTNDKTVSKVENKAATNDLSKSTPSKQQRKVRPAADIYETKEGATIYIDLPGVAKDGLDINIDQNVLSVEGEINLDTPDDLQPTYMDIRANMFSRQFTLSSELDINKVDANLKNGVLILSIPRSEQHKPRKIEVKAA